MNPKLVKFAVELQTGERIEKENNKNNHSGNGGGKKILNFLKLKKAAVPVDKN